MIDRNGAAMSNAEDDLGAVKLEVSKLMDRILLAYSQLDIQLTDDPRKVVAWIGFHLGRDYYKGTELALNKKLLLSSSSLVRTATENVADLFYIYCTPNKTDKYATAYIASINTFTSTINKMKQEGGLEARVLKQINPWTNATIDDRVKAVGYGLQNTYDLLSYFSHPNPAAITYLGNQKLKHGQLELVSHSSCVVALFLMAVVLSHSDITSVSREELDKIAQSFGVELI